MAKKSASQVSPKDVTGIPTPAGPASNAGIVKRIVQGGGKAKLDKQGHQKPDSTSGR